MSRTPSSAHLPSAAGIDILLADRARLAALRHRRVALLSNLACRTGGGIASVQALDRALGGAATPGLVCWFVPEHGAAANQPAGATIADAVGTAGGPAVISLYGARRAPTAEHLGAIDTLVIDLRDVGVRCYTYAATAALAASAALDAGREVIVCDRANPLGSGRDGPPLDPAYRSFLAYFDVPFVHGQSLGGLLSGALHDHPRAAAMMVIAPPADDARDSAPWVPPSPALQSPASVRLYPGLVLLEGTNLSEGRGTALSFRCAGAPWLDAPRLAAAANHWPTGVTASPCDITPASGDYAGQSLPAVRFDPGDDTCDGFGLGVRLLAWLIECQPELRWRRAAAIPAGAPDDAPDKAPQGYAIDVLLGSAALRDALLRGDSADTILARWRR